MKFLEFLELGFEHIADWNAYDHILFIVVMCAVYQVKDWRKILILVTAFTIGHSLTLALAISKIVSIDKDLVEFLIPSTIILTAIWNMIPKKEQDLWGFRNPKNLLLLDEMDEDSEHSTSKNWLSSNYIMVLFFGLIHGLGFSNYLGMLLGRNEGIFIPLLGFNVGVELGQICIIAIFMLVSFICLDILKIKQKYWIGMISILAIVVSLKLMIGN
ncbi:MAG: hypothetical protein ACI94Y_002379 [Maribacter sp.]|jgi:hypothetical protein